MNYSDIIKNISPNLQRAEFEKKGIEIKVVPRYLTWLKAHSREENGSLVFDNPLDLAVADAILSSF